MAGQRGTTSPHPRSFLSHCCPYCEGSCVSQRGKPSCQPLGMLGPCPPAPCRSSKDPWPCPQASGLGSPLRLGRAGKLSLRSWGLLQTGAVSFPSLVLGRGAGEDLTTTAAPRTSRWGRRNCQKSVQLKRGSRTQGLERAGGPSSASHSATRPRRGHLLRTRGPRRTPPTQRQAEGLRMGAGSARGRRARSWERSRATAPRRQALGRPSEDLQGENAVDGSRAWMALSLAARHLALGLGSALRGTEASLVTAPPTCLGEALKQPLFLRRTHPVESHRNLKVSAPARLWDGWPSSATVSNLRSFRRMTGRQSWTALPLQMSSRAGTRRGPCCLTPESRLWTGCDELTATCGEARSDPKTLPTSRKLITPIILSPPGPWVLT